MAGSPSEIGWHILVSAQSVVLADVVENLVMPGWIMMVSMIFQEKALKLISVFFLDFVMPVVFYFVSKYSTSIQNQLLSMLI